MSSSLGRLQASLAAATNDVTLAAANINFDFSLVKFEAPKEFQPLGETLSLYHKKEAEHGTTHITARRLGALFEGICPSTPNLLKAYGQRVSEISKAATVKIPKAYTESVFSAYTGVDGSSIWAAATSSGAALHVHLLSCILARALKPTEATAAWVELVKERRRDIAIRLDGGESLSFASASAAGQADIPRSQLADWDASARAWLHTADSVKEIQQKNLDLILKNVHMEVKSADSTFASIISVWKTSLKTMEGLVMGIPQAVRDGSALLGLSAWHLFPDMAVLGPRTIDLRMKDPLIEPGGVLTLGFRDSADIPQNGVYWSLSLAHLRYYGHPVEVMGEVSANVGRVSFDELMQCVLGALLALWGFHDDNVEPAMRFFIAIAQTCQIQTSGLHFEEQYAMQAIQCLADVSSAYIEGDEEERAKMGRLIKLGARRHRNFFGLDRDRPHAVATVDNMSESDTSGPDTKILDMPFFGLLNDRILITAMASTEGTIQFLRRLCSQTTPVLAPEHTFIRFYESPRSSSNPNTGACYATAQPINLTPRERKRKRGTGNETPLHARWMHGQNSFSNEVCIDLDRKSRTSTFKFQSRDLDLDISLPTKGDGAPETFKLYFGHSDIAGLFISSTVLREFPFSWTVISREFLSKNLHWCLDSGLISPRWLLRVFRNEKSPVTRTLISLAVARKVYKMIPDAKLSLEVLQKPLALTRWSTSLWEPDKELGAKPESVMNWITLSRAFSLLAFFESGSNDLDPRDLEKVIALSYGDAMYIDMRLLCDPYERPEPYEIRRVLGNIGKAGIIMLIAPKDPMFRKPDPNSWKLANYQPFDGVAEDSFKSTSVHLSFTEYYAPFNTDNHGLHDSQVAIMEAIISVRDAGKWVADIDIAAAFGHIRRFDPQPPCEHEVGVAPRSSMVAVDSWEELLDPPSGLFVVRAHKNWIARLAILAFLSRHQPQSDFPLTVCPKSICWQCASQEFKRHAFIC